MSGLDDKFIEQLKNKVDIVDLVGQYTRLQHKGGQYWACCPLPGHSERTPSFAINKDGQFYHCFGCHKGGDVIKFVEETESLEFVEAVKFLCDKYKIEMPELKKSDEKRNERISKKERILSLLKDTALFYVKNLEDKKSKPFHEYMQKRGLTHSVIRRFGLGASLDYNSLPKFLKEKGYTEQEMLDSGTVSKSDSGRLFDCQAERLIFPVINNFGDVIAFCGRILFAKEGVGKYKNTRETQVFVKNKTLYNINNLKKEKLTTDLKYVIVVEGHMDAVSVYNAGFRNVVASMGTAFTKEQAKLLKRYSEKILISFDGDAAGQKGMLRGLEILRDEGLDVKVVCLPDGMDPDDVINKQGTQAYQKLLDEALSLIDYKLYLVNKKYDSTTLEGKRAVTKESVAVISECDSESEKEERLRALSKKMQITYESLYKDLNNVKTSKEEVSIKEEKNKSQVPDKILQAERFVLAAILYKKPYVYADDLEEIEFLDQTNSSIAEFIKEKISNGQEIKISVISGVLGDGGYEDLNSLLMSGEGVFDKPIEQRYYSDCLIALKKENLTRQIEKLNAEYTSETDMDKRKQIAVKILEKSSRLTKL